jgi:hypothetical protein
MVVCCQVVSATSWSLIQRSPTDWHIIVCNLETSWIRWPLCSGGYCAKNKNIHTMQLILCATYHFLSLAYKEDMWIYSRQVKVFKWARKYKKQDLIIQQCCWFFRPPKVQYWKQWTVNNNHAETVSLHKLSIYFFDWMIHIIYLL